jgi:TetR/AcrR family transcriptional repressor of nem operon
VFDENRQVPQRSVREQVVEAGLDQFHQHGFNGAGVKDITDAAGVPKGSFYNHFESKEALALVVLGRYGETLQLEKLTDTAVPPLDRLREHFTFLQAKVVDAGFTRGCLFGNFGAEMADHSDTIRGGVRDAFAQWSDLLAECVRQAQAEGTVRSTLDASDTARFIMQAWEGTLLVARAEQTTGAFDRFFTFVFSTVLTS